MNSGTGKIALLLCINVCIFGLTACQKTPEQAIVVDKSEGLLSENIIPIDNDTPKDLKAPEHWQEELEMSDGYVTMSVDCDLHIPDVYNTPVCSYEIRPMTNELLESLCDYFAEGNRLYENPRMTKAELESEKEKIENYEDEWAHYKESLFYAGQRERIEILNGLIEEAPVEPEERRYLVPELSAPVATDQERMRNSPSGGWYYFYYDTDEKIGFTARVETGEACDPIIRAISCDEAVGSTTKFLYSRGIFKDEVELERDFDNSRMMERVNDDCENYLNFLKSELEHAQDESFTEEDALKMVEQILKDLSIENLTVVDCVKAIGTTEYESWAGLKNGVPAQAMGYSFYLSPEESGLTAFTLPRTLQGGELPESVYAPSFLPEQLKIIVTKDGIQKFEWLYPSEKKETIAENTRLMTFEEIKEKFEDHLLYYTISMDVESAKESGYTSHFEVKDVQLRTANINAFEDPSSAWLVPVWVFEVLYQSRMPDGKLFVQSTTYFLMNAIDGGYVTMPMFF